MVPDELDGCPNVQGSELFEGCTVHYVAPDGRCLVGTVIGHDNATNRTDLVVFASTPDANGVKHLETQFHQDIEYSKELKPDTWHWIA